jgi:hypothetical protein
VKAAGKQDAGLLGNEVNLVGILINNRLTTAKELLKLSPPVILCVNRTDIKNALSENEFKTVSLNLPLARLLTGLDLMDARTALVDSMREILPLNEPIYLIDYEMLFDPRYEIDVLRLFAQFARQGKLIVKWCGRIQEETLTYAEPGYSDYKQFKIEDYDVVVVN